MSYKLRDVQFYAVALTRETAERMALDLADMAIAAEILPFIAEPTS